MPLTLTQVEKQAFMLSQDQQLQLVQDIMSKQVLSKEEEAWLDKAERRAQEIDNGKATLIDSKTAFNYFTRKSKIKTLDYGKSIISLRRA